MRKFLITSSLIFLCFVKISKEFSYEIDSKYLFVLDKGCKNVDIRINEKYFEKLTNCKVIHGYLRVSDLEIPSNFSKIFGDIFEVTGYVLIDNVIGMKSLGQLFPNLTIIRGEVLHHGKSLIITNNFDLKNIGTGELTTIQNGDVLIENNNNLCYTQTVDWTQLRKGLKSVIKNNSMFCNESCSRCWNEEIPQKLCTNCDSCLDIGNNTCCDNECTGGCTGTLSNCVACKHFKYFDGNVTKCSLYEPATFELENYYLVNGETCNRINMTRLDEKCIQIDDCPTDENHYYIEDHCVYCEKCAFENCSISIHSMLELKQLISTCQVATDFIITNLDDSMEESVQKLLTDKLSNIVEIQNCLIIRNSSGIANLKFLRKLKRIITTNDGTDCEIEGSQYSLILDGNSNLQEGFSNDISEIFVDNGLYIKNNRNFCQYSINKLSTIFALTPESSESFYQMNECIYPAINVNVFPTNESVLIFTDAIISSHVKLQIIYFEGNSTRTKKMDKSFIEIKNLHSNQTYPFKIEVINSKNESIYTTNYQFFKTHSSKEFLTNIEALGDSDSISIRWKIADITDESTTDYMLYIMYQEISKDYCNATKNLQIDSSEQYFLQDPKFQDENYGSYDLINVQITEYELNISNLSESTCYRFDIYPCIELNYLMCKNRLTICQQTKNHVANEESGYKYTKLIIAIIFCTIFVAIIIYYFMSRNKKEIETYLELSIQGGVEVDQWELDRGNIVQTKVLGSGEFGIVYQGYIKPNKEIFYAIKSVAPAREFYEDNFLKEAQIMRRFNSSHVVKLIGYCTKERPLLVVMELMLHGDLKKFLQKNRPSNAVEEIINETEISNYTVVPSKKTVSHPIRPVSQMAIEIADGMMYLSSMNFIHCDLACRNLMVHESYTIKIGDFGMARELYHVDYYKLGSRNKKIPLRWMAPETLGSEKLLPRYTSKSDVFSYGIVLFELVTFCETPYAGCLDEEVIEIIKMGRTLDRPKDCEDKIYELMKKCWCYNPDDRITFKEIVEYLLQNYDIPNFKNVSFYHKNN